MHAGKKSCTEFCETFAKACDRNMPLDFHFPSSSQFMSMWLCVLVQLGVTPLHVCTDRADQPMVTVLLGFGADSMAFNMVGFALMLCWTPATAAPCC